ncbi:AAA family ATPase [Actinoplanes sp. KI2]|uniref:helix-turn-helix transcriptional regulator n=1 Tax=Actinoplanes sp. KI2 TaxID=2983315 RepID=UPI0021D6146A|nr:LuxR family transcriptional regulator [Actinoplanes sp. KI2]MCU7725956.1 AAA family ATPase [Actinoplanes sp. KI2]
MTTAGLVGRAIECRAVLHLLEKVRQERHSQVLVIRGEPGIGKTSLTQFACREATGMLILSVTGTPTETDLPFAGLHALLQPLLEFLPGMPEGQRAALEAALALAPGAPENRFATYAATFSLITTASARQPMLICVDDLHWLDVPTVEALSFTARRLQADPVGLIMAERSAARSSLDVRPFQVINLGGLIVGDAVRLLDEAGTPAIAPVVEQLARQTGGNPLALREVAAQLSAAQRSGTVPVPEPLPAGLAAEELFAERIRGLGDAARIGLLVAAAEPAAELRILLRAAAELGERDDLFDQAEKAGLIRVDGVRVQFRHPLIPSTVFALTTDAERRAAHRAVAGALDGPEDADRRAWHLAHAATGRDEQAAHALETAAANARRRGGYAAAAAALARAAALTEGAEPRAARLRGAAENARVAGQVEAAMQYLEVALDLATETRLRAELIHTLGRIHLFHGRVRQAVTMLAQGSELLDQHAQQAADAIEATSLLAESAFAALLAGRVVESLDMARRACDRVPEPGSSADLISQLILGTALFHLTPTSESRRVLVNAAAIAETNIATVDPEYAVFAALALLWTGQVERAEALLRHVEEYARRSVALGLLPCVLYGWSYVRARTGRFSVASAQAAEAVAIADETGEHLWRYFNGGCLAYIAAMRGREEECLAHLATVTETARRLEIEYPATIQDSLGLLALSLGRYQEAIDQLEPVNRAGLRETGQIMLGRPTAFDLVEAYLRAGRPLEPDLAEQVDTLSRQDEFPAVAALAMRCRGLDAAEDYDELFAAAYRMHDAAPNALARARTALCHGERLRRSGRRIEARRHLRAAFDAFTRMDAGVWISRAKQELRAAGERVVPAAEGLVAQLTPQELQIAMSVAGGLSNRETARKLFLSEKTVEFHLSRIYRKIGVRSRTELARQILTQ